MLRHIWNTNQYGPTIKAMKDNADKMGHSLSQAIDYIKEKRPIAFWGNVNLLTTIERFYFNLHGK